MNYHAQPLQLHEVTKMKASPIVIERITKSYALMLDFYGMKLVSPETGLLKRSDDYKARYRNLLGEYSKLAATIVRYIHHDILRSERSHNYLRITRILKCLSELELEHLNVGFLLHVLSEQSETQCQNRIELSSLGIKNSMDRWWANCLRHDEDRKWIGMMIRRVRNEQNFVFTRDMYQNALERKRSTGRLSDGRGMCLLTPVQAL